MLPFMSTGMENLYRERAGLHLNPRLFRIQRLEAVSDPCFAHSCAVRFSVPL
jgi:hypothetical protein